MGTSQAVFESGVFFLQLFTSKDAAYKTCKLEGITLAKWEIHIVSSAMVDWFVFSAYSVVIFKLSATSKLDLNASDSKLACKIQLNNRVSPCICILRIVTKIGVNARYYYRIMKFLGSVSRWKINSKDTNVMKPHSVMQSRCCIHQKIKLIDKLIWYFKFWVEA